MLDKNQRLDSTAIPAGELRRLGWTSYFAATVLMTLYVVVAGSLICSLYRPGLESSSPVGSNFIAVTFVVVPIAILCLWNGFVIVHLIMNRFLTNWQVNLWTIALIFLPIVASIVYSMIIPKSKIWKISGGAIAVLFLIGLVAYVGSGGIKSLNSDEIKQIKSQAEAGDAESEYYLAMEYMEGKNIPKDDVTAVQWLKKAAEQGMAEAQYNLCVAYDQGIGMPINQTEAVKWCLKAAAQNDVNAEVNLAKMYEEGIGVPKNQAEAKKWYQKAAEQGDEESKAKLDSMKEK